VIPVLQARVLLGSSGHQTLIEEVRLRSGLGKKDFERLYEDFLNRFAEFVQLIPVKSNLRLGTLLNEALLRGINSLHYLVENHKDADELERYALFTAAVLYDVAIVLLNQRIFITEENGIHRADWVFSQGDLRNQDAKWYKIFPMKASYTRLRDSVTALLAQQIMPPEGYRWITTYWAVFVDWLDALCQTGGVQGKRFNKILDIIRLHEDELLWLEKLPDIAVDLKEPEETLVADEFFRWLDREINEEKLKINGVEPDLYVLQDGLFIDSRVIDRFSKYYNAPSAVVWSQIGNCLGIDKKGRQDFRFDQFFGARGKGLLQTSSQSLVKGLFLSNDFVQINASPHCQVTLQVGRPARNYPADLKLIQQPTSNK
jgi:hypothetical protein